MTTELRIGMPLNSAEVAALSTLFPAATFTVSKSGHGYGGVASSVAELQAIRLAMQHRMTYILDHDRPETNPAHPVHDTACEVCHKIENTIRYPTGEYLCPKHTRSNALTNAAHEHLSALLAATITGWVRHWGVATSPENAADAISWVTETLAAMTPAERLEQVKAVLEDAEK